MRILKLHHPTGHPYWHAGEFEVELPNGTFYPKDRATSHKIEVMQDGVYYVPYHCSSGGGKIPWNDNKRYPIIKIISSSEYDKIEYVGEELEISANLKNDLAENRLK